MTTKPSTDRVRQFRKRQRAANRRLVRIYLPGDAAAKLAQLSADAAGRGFAEALFAGAIVQAWSQREARRAAETDERQCGGRSQETIRFPGRRRSFAAQAR